jgi:site-specific recombinase XerC
VTGGMEVCCVQRGVAIKYKLHKKSEIVKTFVAFLFMGNRVDVLCSTCSVNPPQNARKLPKRIEIAHLLLLYDVIFNF